jgi:hypothetical protein
MGWVGRAPPRGRHPRRVPGVDTVRWQATRRGGYCWGIGTWQGRTWSAVPVPWLHAHDVRLVRGHTWTTPGVYPRPRAKDRPVMRLSDPVRV